ncbi:hypothetical protein H4S03_000563 [Coemansia sp. S3946]|nr:hypothetical protein H4S03_000563 [Coemansia sp. S3946]
MNIQKLFDVCDNDFAEMWQDGILLYNISLTEEEEGVNEKIPHEVFWSQLFEAFLDYLSTNYNNIRFCFTGSTCNKYKKDFEKFRADAVLDSNVKKLDKILSGVNEILAKVEGVTKSERVDAVSPGRCVIYVNVDEVFIKKGTSRNVAKDEVMELLRKTRSITVVNVGGEDEEEERGFSSDTDMYLDDISPNESEEDSS